LPWPTKETNEPWEWGRISHIDLKRANKGMTFRATRESAVRLHYPINSLLYSHGGKVFQIAVEIEDVPGSLNSVLELVSGRIDLKNTISFSHGKGLASWRAFAHAIDRNTTAEGVKLRIQGSPFVKNVEVTEGKELWPVPRARITPHRDVGCRDEQRLRSGGKGLRVRV
jgi:hypothetical protein